MEFIKSFEWFSCLIGSWRLERQIKNFKINKLHFIKGKVNFSPEKQINTLNYLEEVHWEDLGLDLKREYLYQYDETSDIVKIFYPKQINKPGLQNDLDDKWELFLNLEFDKNLSQCSEHLCGKDLYKAYVNIKDKNEFEILYQVIGPDKHYDSVTNYIKILES